MCSYHVKHMNCYYTLSHMGPSNECIKENVASASSVYYILLLKMTFYLPRTMGPNHVCIYFCKNIQRLKRAVTQEPQYS